MSMGQPQQPPGPGGGRVLDWRQLVQAVQQANPKIEPAVLMEAVNQFLPMMSAQSQQEWRQVSLQIREQQLDQRERQFLMTQSGKAADRESKEGIADKNRVSKETIAKMTVDERREAHEAGLISKEQMDEANRTSREGIADKNRESREKVAGEKLEQGEKHFQQRETRLQESLKLREDSTWQRLEQQKQAAIQRAEAAQGRQGLAEARAAIDAQDKHVRTRIQAYSQNNTMKPAERKALLDQADMDYNTEIAKLRERFGRSTSAGGTTSNGPAASAKVPDRAPSADAGSSPPAAAAPAKPAAGAVSIPPEAVSALKEGQVTTFENGQKWTLQGGKPVQVP
jgi:hypothetical protein